MKQEENLCIQEDNSMITIKARGDFRKTESFFNRLIKADYVSILSKYGRMGVDALTAATPQDSGRTASSWEYQIIDSGNSASIVWSNTNVNNGVNIAIILQYGHGTGTGGYVQGRDYINPAMQPIFDEIANEAWMEVIRT